MTDWYIYRKADRPGELVAPHDDIRQPDKFPDPPPWRAFKGQAVDPPEVPPGKKRYQVDQLTWRENDRLRGEKFQADATEVEMVNTALLLRRPLLVTGNPGTGKSSLAYAVAHQLNLGPVLRWPITSRANLADGLYHYDAVGRLQEIHAQREKGTDKDNIEDNIGKYIRLGPLGTALLPTEYPRVLLIDEIDKSDIDLPNDLLNIFEDGEYEIPELSRLAEEVVWVRPYDTAMEVPIHRGKIICQAFPFIILTSNRERELPQAFLRRCLRLDIKEPSPEKLQRIVKARFQQPEVDYHALIKKFVEHREKGMLANDQLLNALYLVTQGIELETIHADRPKLLDIIWRHLDSF